VNITLVLVKSDGTSREVKMKRARLVIGRQQGCDVRIPLPAVSREHCELRVENNALVVRDLGSSNGTFVNRVRVQDEALEPGDLLAVGPAVFVVRINGEPVEIDAATQYAEGAGPKPVAAAKPGGRARPSDPSAAKVGGRRQGQPAPPLDDDPNEGSSISGLDFDFLDEDDEDKKQPRL
jgi:pSer/pThr/pTyr-binding forkhead associated (FHA) protein